MTRFTSSALIVALLVVGASAGISADTKSKEVSPPTSKSKKDDSSTSKKAKSKNRLPFYYGKLDLTPEQKEKVYAVQKKHRPQIEELKAQLAKLEEAEDKECEAVLTTSQKSTLSSLRQSKSKETTSKKSATKNAKSADKSES